MHRAEDCWWTGAVSVVRCQARDAQCPVHMMLKQAQEALELGSGTFLHVGCTPFCHCIELYLWVMNPNHFAPVVMDELASHTAQLLLQVRRSLHFTVRRDGDGADRSGAVLQCCDGTACDACRCGGAVHQLQWVN